MTAHQKSTLTQYVCSIHVNTPVSAGREYISINPHRATFTYILRLDSHGVFECKYSLRVNPHEMELLWISPVDLLR